jgi:hypothetical protein
VYILIAIPFALIAIPLVCRFWVYENFTTLQKEYLNQYFWSGTYSWVFPRSPYRCTTLVRTVVDPKTKQETVLAVLDDDIIPDLDDDNHLKTDENDHIKIFLKRGIAYKSFKWDTTPVAYKQAYDWFREHVYKDSGLIGIWTNAWWLGALLVLVAVSVIAFGVDMYAQHVYLKGDRIRGTRKLSISAYAREHRKHIGYGFKVYNPK